MIDSLTQNAKIQRKCLKMWDNRSFSAKKLFLNQKQNFYLAKILSFENFAIVLQSNINLTAL